jgi:uncharacterized protein YlbG (UPF0298 family)
MKKGRYVLIEVKNDEVLSSLKRDLKGIAKVFKLKELSNFGVIKFKVDKRNYIFEVIAKNDVKTITTSGSLKKVKRIAKAKLVQKEV